MLSTMRRRFYDQNLRGFTTKYKSPVSKENRGCRLQSRGKKNPKTKQWSDDGKNKDGEKRHSL